MGFFCHDGQIIDVCKRGNVFFVTNGFVKEISALKTKLCLALCLKQPVGCGYVRIVKLYLPKPMLGALSAILSTQPLLSLSSCDEEVKSLISCWMSFPALFDLCMVRLW